MPNALNWFEIPVKDLERATKFYQKILGQKMAVMEAMGMKSAFFPADMENGSVGGCLIVGKGYKPAATGTLVYLNAGKNLSTVLSKIVKAGGEVILPKTAIGHNGFMAHFKDTEGNKVGLHSMK